ncbi:cell proliferation protein [Saccharomycopsis crataegensis]|uniref:Cell proliferation protein n=1 Tax=Saccharomycopsis crataegensis TaxID=43959 RepID=A0AAV5QVS5_9ASCO|nr:cell proliferation protein [Saccharomycopsis crataegensis]
MEGTHYFEDIPITKQQVLNCAYGSWYPRYKKITPKSHIISSLPQSFIEYILQDGIKMPPEFFVDYILEDASEYSDWEQSDDEQSVVTPEARKHKQQQRRSVEDPTKNFSEIHEQIKSLIQKNGPMLPKLNWSAPKDAAWILPNHSLKCSSASEVYLLLNASSYIVHDLSQSLDECSDIDVANLKKEHKGLKFDLILKEWFDINPAWEFRCFVRDRRIVAVSQRDPNYYDYLHKMKESIKDKLFDFFDIHLKRTFQSETFVFDVYLPDKSEKVWLIDINPFSRTTDSLLYSWHEILNLDLSNYDEDDFDMRLVNEFSTARFASKEHSENYVPKDMIDAAMDTEKMIELMKAYQQQQLSDSSGDEADE